MVILIAGVQQLHYNCAEKSLGGSRTSYGLNDAYSALLRLDLRDE